MTTAPWETPTEVHPKPALAADFVDRMLTDIRTKVVDNRFEDDALTPDLLGKVLSELRAAILGDDARQRYEDGEEEYSDAVEHPEAGLTPPVDVQVGLWAGNLLQALWHRAVAGVPFGEPAEPAWSLDPELPRTEEG